MKNELMIYEQKKQAVVSSRTVAEIFNKRHDNLFSEIERMYSSLIYKGHAQNQGHPPMFFKSKYIHEQNGQEYKEYLMNRDGFSLLVMGFTGTKALDWKLKYIEAFNKMEEAIRERQSTEWLTTRKKGKLVRREETDNLALLLQYAIEQGSKNYKKSPQKLYINYSNLVNSLVGIETGEREFVDFKTLSTIMFLEDMILHTVVEEMENGTYYKDIYKKCRANGENIVKFAYLSNGNKNTKLIR